MQSKIAGLTWSRILPIGGKFFEARDRLPIKVRSAAFQRYIADPRRSAAPSRDRGSARGAQEPAELLPPARPRTCSTSWPTPVPARPAVKHNNPCGCAVAGTALEAYERALACDPQSAFGGIVCFNWRVDGPLAEALLQQFVELVFAPQFTGDALEVLSARPNLRILEDNEQRRENIGERDIKRVIGGLLVQDRDDDLEDRTQMEVVTERKPTEREWGEMLFAWKVCKHVRSNAIVLAKDLASVGIGAGQMSRIDSVWLAIEKARAVEADLRAPRWRPTRSSRSPTARSSRWTRASPRSSSRAAPSATQRWSRPPMPPASRWSSPTVGTSGIEPQTGPARRGRCPRWGPCRGTVPPADSLAATTGDPPEARCTAR